MRGIGYISFILIIVCLNVAAESEKRQISDFTKVELEGYGILTFTQGKTPSLTIEAESRVLGDIATSVDDETLTIKPIRYLRSQSPVTYQLTVKKLEAIDVEGAAEVHSQGTLKVDELDISIKGAAKAFLTIEGEKLDVDIDGAGQVTLTGSVDHQEVEIDGAGKYHAIDLKSKEAEIEINGAGKAQVYVTDRLDVEVNGAGSVTYKGSPTVAQSIRGIGSVTPL